MRKSTWEAAERTPLPLAKGDAFEGGDDCGEFVILPWSCVPWKDALSS